MSGMLRVLVLTGFSLYVILLKANNGLPASMCYNPPLPNGACAAVRLFHIKATIATLPGNKSQSLRMPPHTDFFAF